MMDDEVAGVFFFVVADFLAIDERVDAGLEE